MRFRSWIASLGIAVLALGIAWAQEKPEKAKPGAMDEKAMEAIHKAATPGEAHKKLEAMIGTFDAKVKMWMDPSSPAEESSGTSVSTWVLGNRFVETKHEGTFMGQPFSGIGYTGYDNLTKEYVGTWMDTASTSMMVSKGTMAGNVMKSSSKVVDPMTGKPMPITMKTTVTDNDHHTMEMWCPGPDGKVYKMMEITYTRKM